MTILNSAQAVHNSQRAHLGILRAPGLVIAYHWAGWPVASRSAWRARAAVRLDLSSHGGWLNGRRPRSATAARAAVVRSLVSGQWVLTVSPQRGLAQKTQPRPSDRCIAVLEVRSRAGVPSQTAAAELRRVLRPDGKLSAGLLRACACRTAGIRNNVDEDVIRAVFAGLGGSPDAAPRRFQATRADLTCS